MLVSGLLRKGFVKLLFRIGLGLVEGLFRVYLALV